LVAESTDQGIIEVLLVFLIGKINILSFFFICVTSVITFYKILAIILFGKKGFGVVKGDLT
jgi:hypothetical protein